MARIKFTTPGTSGAATINTAALNTLPEYSGDVAAAAGGLAIGDYYRMSTVNDLD